jgi:hypothetical protein
MVTNANMLGLEVKESWGWDLSAIVRIHQEVMILTLRQYKRVAELVSH